jgi:hypothetical protein
VAVNCSTDAIVPAWASILVTINSFCQKVINIDLNAALYEELLAKIDFSAYVNKSIIIKAVRKPVPHACLCFGCTEFTTLARSIMYGEACSAVPLYKAKKIG